MSSLLNECVKGTLATYILNDRIHKALWKLKLDRSALLNLRPCVIS